MKTKVRGCSFATAACFIFYFSTLPMLGHDREPGAESEVLPTGQTISPLAAPGAHLDWLNPGLADFPTFVAGGGMTTVISPDQQTLPAPRQCRNRCCRCRTPLPESPSIRVERSFMLGAEKMTTFTRSSCKPMVP